MKKIFTIFAALLMAGSMMAEFDTWSVVGSKAIMNGTEDWAIAETANDMTTEDGVTYTLTVTGKTLEAGTTYEYKIAKEHKWSNGEFPNQNAKMSVSETAVYDIVYTANVSEKTHSAVATKAGEAGEITHTYSIAGSSADLFGAAWSETNTATEMTKGEDGIYSWTKENVELAAGTILYKVVVDHAWGESYPSQNATLVIAEDAAYDVVFTFNPANKAVNATATKAGVEPGPGPEPETTVYYIKHNWGGAGNWTWKEMTYDAEAENYTLREIYGATGCNWNTSASDEGSSWVASPTVVGNPAVGDSAVFALKNGEITITKIGEPAPEPTTRFLKHNWGGAGNWTWKEMTREGETDTYTLRDIYGGTGCNWNTVGDEAGATWVATPTLEGEPAVGDSAVFALVNGEITITKIEGEGPGPEPTYNYYLAGTMTEWGSVGMEGDSAVLNLEAGEHGFKIQLVAGYWDNALGIGAVNAECSSKGYYGNNDGNVCFTLAEAGEVKIKVIEGQICVTGAFETPEPTLPQVDLKGINDDWAGVTMVPAEDKQTCSYTYTLTEGKYAFKLYIEDAWLGNNGTMDRGNCTDWLFEEGTDNCGLTADVDGDYVFTYTYETGKVSVTFPDKTVTGMQNVQMIEHKKMVINGQLIIFRDGKRYSATGMELK